MFYGREDAEGGGGPGGTGAVEGRPVGYIKKIHSQLRRAREGERK